MNLKDPMQFTISPDARDSIRKKFLFHAFKMMALIFAVSLGVMLWKGGEELSSPVFLLYLVILVGGAVAVGIRMGLKNQERMLLSYRLTLDGQHIIREVDRAPVLSIPYTEVQEIVRLPNGDLLIKGRSALDAIGVPLGMDRFSELEILLTQIHPITEQTKMPLMQQMYWPLIILMIGAMGTTFYAENKFIVLLCGVPVAALMAYSIFVIRRSKNTTHFFKRSAWLVVLVLLSLIIRMVWVWMKE